MERLHKSSGSSGTKDDIDLDTETLWGLHTIEPCYIRFKLAASRNEIDLSRQYESHALALVTEKEIVFVLMSSGVNAAVTVVDMIRLFKKGKKYRVLFSKMIDITVHRESLSRQLYDDGLHQTLKVLLPEGLGGCEIDTQNTTNLIRQTLSTWQSHQIRKSACLSSLHGIVGSEIADRYYRETIKGIDIAAENMQEVQEILEEISDELWADLELKEAVLRSRELIVICLVIIQSMVNDPRSLSGEKKFIGAKYGNFAVGGRNNSSSSSTTSDDRDLFKSGSMHQPSHSQSQSFSTSSNLRRSSSGVSAASTSGRVKMASLTPSAERFSARVEVARQLFTDAVRRTNKIVGGSEELGISGEERSLLMQPVVLQRLSLVRTAFKTIASVLSSSEGVAIRYGILAGPIPLDLDSWCSILVPDLYDTICNTLGCQQRHLDTEVAQALTVVPNAQKDRNSYTLAQSPAVRRLWQIQNGESLAKSLLTPMKNREVQKSMEVEEIAPKLLETRQGVRDLQLIVSYEIARIAAIGYSSAAAVTTLVLSKHPTTQSQALIFFGDSFSRQPDWEGVLEEIVVRVSTLLDDMLCSDAIAAHVANAGASRLKGRTTGDKTSFRRSANSGADSDASGDDDTKTGVAAVGNDENNFLPPSSSRRPLRSGRRSRRKEEADAAAAVTAEGKNHTGAGGMISVQEARGDTKDHDYDYRTTGTGAAATLRTPSSKLGMFLTENGKPPPLRVASSVEASPMTSANIMDHKPPLHAHFHPDTTDARDYDHDHDNAARLSASQSFLRAKISVPPSPSQRNIRNAKLKKQKDSIRKSKEAKEKERQKQQRESGSDKSSGEDGGDGGSAGRRRRRRDLDRDREGPPQAAEEEKKAPTAPVPAARSAFFPETVRAAGDRNHRKGKGLGVAFSQDLEDALGEGGVDSGESDDGTTPRNKASAAGSRSPLETQEILLFYSVSLLHTMSLDSAKVRSVLRYDLGPYWTAIMHVFNMICPRPETTTASDYNYHDRSRDNVVHTLSNVGRSSTNQSTSGGGGGGAASNTGAQGAAANTAAAGSSVPPAKAPAPQQTSSSSISSSFFGLFKKKQPTATGDVPGQAHFPVSGDRNNRPTSDKNTSRKDEEYLTANGKKAITVDDILNAKPPPPPSGMSVLVPEYGPPQFGLSEASWTLLVLSRRTIEELIIVLKLDKEVPFTINYPTVREMALLEKERNQSSAAVDRDRKRHQDIVSASVEASRASFERYRAMTPKTAENDRLFGSSANFSRGFTAGRAADTIPPSTSQYQPQTQTQQRGGVASVNLNTSTDTPQLFLASRHISAAAGAVTVKPTYADTADNDVSFITSELDLREDDDDDDDDRAGVNRMIPIARKGSGSSGGNSGGNSGSNNGGNSGHNSARISSHQQVSQQAAAAPAALLPKNNTSVTSDAICSTGGDGIGAAGGGGGGVSVSDATVPKPKRRVVRSNTGGGDRSTGRDLEEPKRADSPILRKTSSNHRQQQFQ